MAASESFEIVVRWDVDGTPAPRIINQILIQQGPDVEGAGTSEMMYMHLGHVMPPLIPDDATPEDVQGRYQFGIPVNVVATLAVSRERLAQFHRVIGDALAKASNV